MATKRYPVPVNRHPCGCVSARHREAWLDLCDPHKTEFNELHQRHLEFMRSRSFDAAEAVLS